MNLTIRTMDVAAVVQPESVYEGSPICWLARNTKLHIITLHLLKNKFASSGTTDTGNRPFNTTHVP